DGGCASLTRRLDGRSLNPRGACGHRRGPGGFAPRALWASCRLAAATTLIHGLRHGHLRASSTVAWHSAPARYRMTGREAAAGPPLSLPPAVLSDHAVLPRATRRLKPWTGGSRPRRYAMNQ